MARASCFGSIVSQRFDVAPLDELDAVSRRLRQVVKLRFLGGVPESDIGRMLGVSTRTVERDWLRQLEDSTPASSR